MNTQRRRDTRLGERLVTATESQNCHSVSQSEKKQQNRTHQQNAH